MNRTLLLSLVAGAVAVVGVSVALATQSDAGKSNTLASMEAAKPADAAAMPAGEAAAMPAAGEAAAMPAKEGDMMKKDEMKKDKKDHMKKEEHK